MSGAPISRKPRTLTDSFLLEQLGRDILQIKSEDRLTWKDVGQVLGRERDAAADYGDGTANMPVTAYLRGKREWGTRFTGRVEALVGTHRDFDGDQSVLPSVLDCARGLAEALRDGRICENDVHENRAEIEETINALTGLLFKLDGGK